MALHNKFNTTGGIEQHASAAVHSKAVYSMYMFLFCLWFYSYGHVEAFCKPNHTFLEQAYSGLVLFFTSQSIAMVISRLGSTEAQW